jgi:hypothetical protein
MWQQRTHHASNRAKVHDGRAPMCEFVRLLSLCFSHILNISSKNLKNAAIEEILFTHLERANAVRRNLPSNDEFCQGNRCPARLVKLD